MSHPKTHTMAVLLSRAPEDVDRTADAIAYIFQGYTDEQKADLYALIHEAVNETMSFVELSDAIDDALVKNEEHFRRG